MELLWLFFRFITRIPTHILFTHPLTHPLTHLLTHSLAHLFALSLSFSFSQKSVTPRSRADKQGVEVCVHSVTQTGVMIHKHTCVFLFLPIIARCVCAKNQSAIMNYQSKQPPTYSTKKSTHRQVSHQTNRKGCNCSVSMEKSARLSF